MGNLIEVLEKIITAEKYPRQKMAKWLWVRWLGRMRHILKVDLLQVAEQFKKVDVFRTLVVQLGFQNCFNSLSNDNREIVENGSVLGFKTPRIYLSWK